MTDFKTSTTSWSVTSPSHARIAADFPTRHYFVEEYVAQMPHFEDTAEGQLPNLARALPVTRLGPAHSQRWYFLNYIYAADVYL